MTRVAGVHRDSRFFILNILKNYKNTKESVDFKRVILSCLSSNGGHRLMATIAVKENSRIGEVFTSNEGHEFKIIEYKGAWDVVIQFLDSHGYTKKVQYSKCKNGEVKNPFHPSVHGVGYLGVMSNGEVPKVCDNGKQTREYATWRNMLKRCYDFQSLERNPTYQGCIVVERWHSFSNFLEDMPKIENYPLWLNNPNQGISLDKDLKCKGDKVYSLETCCFLTRSDNAKEVSNRQSGK